MRTRPALTSVLVIPVVLLAAAALFARTFSASPLPEPSRYAGALPAASPPAEMAVYQLPTGVTHRSAGFAYRGGSLLEKRDFAMTAVLVKHPQGDLLIDTGFGTAIDAQLELMPFCSAPRRRTRARPSADQLAAAGYDHTRLRAILLRTRTGSQQRAADFPGTPVWVTADERRFVAEGGGHRDRAQRRRALRGTPSTAARTSGSRQPRRVRRRVDRRRPRAGLHRAR